jgi:hypothetical protein
MILNLSVNSSLPEITNVIMGFVNDVDFYMDIDSTDQNNKDIISNMINLTGKHVVIEIINFDGIDSFESNIVIPDDQCDIEITSLDFNNLSIEEKGIVTSYVNMITALAEEETN